MNIKRQQLKSSCIALALAALAGHVQGQTFTEVVQSALDIYPTVLSAKSKTEAQRADIARARAAHMPQINYGLTRSQYANGELPSTLEATSRSPSVTLNLWAGGRIEADARRAQALTLAGEHTEAQTRDDVALMAAEAYINWARSAELFDLATKNLESHRITLADIETIVQVDTGRVIDLQQAQVRMDNAQLSKQQRETELYQARQRLSRFWQAGGLPAKPMGLKEAVSPAGRLGPVPASMQQLMDAVTDDLPAIATQRAQVKAAEEALKMAKAQFWPTVDLTSSRQLNTAVLPYKQDTLTQVRVNMPLYSGGATFAAVQTAEYQLKAAQYALDEARMVAQEKAVLAYQDWINAQGRAKQGASQASTGDKVVEGYRAQFRLARRQLLDLLNIQAETYGYQAAAITAFYDEQITRARMLAAAGDLAKRF